MVSALAVSVADVSGTTRIYVLNMSVSGINTKEFVDSLIHSPARYSILLSGLEMRK